MAGSAPYYDNIRWGGPQGVRIPQEAFPATMALVKEIDIDVGGTGTTNTITLSLNQTRASYYNITDGGSGATTITWPAVLPGLVFTVFNNTGAAQTCTFKVSGGTGIAVADGKRAILVMDGLSGDIARVTADT